MKGKCVLGITVLLLCGIVHADIWYVHPDSAMNCIQDCLDSCATNDTVLVGPGIYYETITWPDIQGIDLVSEYGPDTTIIDGDSTGRVLSVLFGVDTTTVIDGFTLRNGYAEEGAGLSCTGASPSILNNIITTNGSHGIYFGGAIACISNSSPVIQGNTITENRGSWGGGIFCWDNSSPVISDNMITHNVADTAGGGIICWVNCHPTVTNNTIMANTAPYGGGLYIVSSSHPLVMDNYFAENTASGSGGAIAVAFHSSPNVSDNTITNNTANYGGGGIYCTQYGSPQFIGNSITNNTSSQGAVRCRDNTTPVFKSCTISGNNTYGASLLQCSPSFDSCSVANNQSYGFMCTGDVAAVINWCNIYGHAVYGIFNSDPDDVINAENNWWGDATGPYHPDSNSSGLGDPVSDYVDFDPWLADSVQGIGIEEQPVVKPVEHHAFIGATVFRGPLQLPADRKCKVFDITGRIVQPDMLKPGIYFLQIEGIGKEKVIKIR